MAWNSTKRLVSTMAAKSATLGPVRNLHWVFKVGDRTATADFYQNLLGKYMPFKPFVTSINRDADVLRRMLERMQA